MRGVSYCRVLLFLGLTVISGVSNAAYYSWYSSYFNITAGSPGAVCDQIDGVNNSLSGFVFTSATQAQCKSNAGNPVSSTNMVRNGTGCQPTYTYNTQTGACDAPVGPQECEQTWTGGEKVWSASKQQCVNYPNLSPEEYCTWSSGKANATETVINSNSPNGPSQYVDNTKCVSTNTKSDCVSRVNTNGDGAYRCKVTGQYTGEYNPNGSNMPDGYCATGDCEEPPPPEPDIPTPTPTEYNDTEPCIYQSNGFGGLTCTSSTKNETEGTSNCGTVNGVWGCQNSPPSNNGIEIVSDVNSTTNADGSTTTTKTDTATTTACKGIGQCTTSSSTTTTTTVKDGNGNTTSVSGSCTGPQCPDVNTNPDGDGDGFGDCIGDECGEGGSGGAQDLELEEVPEFGESATTFYNRLLGAPIPTALHELRAPTGGTCATYSATTHYGVVDYSAHCDLVEDKRSLITLIAKTLWSLLAVYILLG